MNTVLNAKDFDPGQQVRWCPGCGDYAVLKSVRIALAKNGAEPHRTVFVSGIGCAARLPYYVNSYGFHTVHGRAPAIATGVKQTRPDLDVWVITGDGDGMSIGAGHLHHVLRRNIDLQILLFNNRIYGLTKGQASPTSPGGLRTATTPEGAPDTTSKPCLFALGSGARFVAREIDINQADLRIVLGAAHAFRGASFVEILQNCPIYNDGTYAPLTDRNQRLDTVVRVEHGKPLVFGKNRDRGIRLRSGSLLPEVVPVDPEEPAATDGILHHDETDPLLGMLLASLEGPDFPVALGVLHRRASDLEPVAAPPSLPSHAERIESVHGLLRKARTWRIP